MDDSEYLDNDFADESEEKGRRKRKSNELTDEGDTEDGKKVRRDYERKRRENLSQAFDELRLVLLDTFNKRSLDSRQLILAEATKCLKMLSDKKKKDNDEWMSTHINDIPGLRELIRYIEELKMAPTSEHNGLLTIEGVKKEPGASSPGSSSVSFEASSGVSNPLPQSKPKRRATRGAQAALNEASPHVEPATTPSPRGGRRKNASSTSNAATTSSPTSSPHDSASASSPTTSDDGMHSGPNQRQPAFVDYGMQQQQQSGSYFEQSAQLHGPYGRQDQYQPSPYGMQADHHFSGVPVVDAGNYTASRYSYSPYQAQNGGFMPNGRGGRPATGAPGNDGFDIALMSQQSTFLVDYTRPMLAVLFFGLLLFVNVDVSSYDTVGAASLRHLSSVSTFSPENIFGYITIFSRVMFASIWAFLGSTTTWIVFGAVLTLYAWLLTTSEPLLPPSPSFRRESRLHARLANKSANLKERRKHVLLALTYLGRRFPVSPTHLMVAITWQCIRAISHFFYIGYYIEDLLTTRRPECKAGAAEALHLYLHVLKRCPVTMSNSELLYVLLVSNNIGTILGSDVISAELYSMCAWVLQFRYPYAAAPFSKALLMMAWRAAKRNRDVTKLTVFLGISLLRNFQNGHWKEAKKLGRILTRKIRETEQKASATPFSPLKGDKDDLLVEVPDSLLATQDLGFVPLTLAGVSFATGELDSCRLGLRETIAVGRSRAIDPDSLALHLEIEVSHLLNAHVAILQDRFEEAKASLVEWEKCTAASYNANGSRSIYMGLKALIAFNESRLSDAFSSVQAALQFSIPSDGLPFWTANSAHTHLSVLLLLWEHSKKSKVEGTGADPSPSAQFEHPADAEYDKMFAAGLKALEPVLNLYPRTLSPQVLLLKGIHASLKTPQNQKQALRFLLQALEEAQQLDMKILIALILLELGKLAEREPIKLKSDEEAKTNIQIFESAKQVFDDCGAVFLARKADEVLQMPLTVVMPAS